MASRTAMDAIRLTVLVPLPLPEPFDYFWSRGDPAPVAGSYVRVPFGPREIIGVVWDCSECQDARALPARLREAGPVLDIAPLTLAMRRLVERTARANVAPLGAVLKLVMSTPAAFEPEHPQQGYAVPLDAPRAELSEKRARVLGVLEREGPLLPGALAKRAAVSSSLLKAMAENGLLAKTAVERTAARLPEPLPIPERDLTPAQRRASDAIARFATETPERPILLEGAPGSGKTEVYLEILRETVKEGRSALVLLPEIALSAQWLARFAERFGQAPLVWHSALTTAQRRRNWKAVSEGRAQVVVGARSALFLPFPELGLIVIDEAHDPSFKQEEGVIYDARAVARERAALEGALLLLVTATPTVEQAVAAGCLAAVSQSITDRHVLLEGRWGRTTPPAIAPLDMRTARPPIGSFISPPLREALAAALAQRQQAMLFLNRRGYSPLTLCRACGFRFRCPSCSAWLVSHRFKDRLICHHCGYGRPTPEHCPECGAVDQLVASGPGVERLQEEVAGFLPQARTAVMTSDTVGSAASAERLVEAMLAHDIDLLIGTQLIAKGHHFPQLTLVGVVDADVGLAGGDLRAAERTFQLLYQLAGRAGREDLPGRVLIQTHLVDHPVMQALLASDKQAFMEAELAERREAMMPPFGRLAALILAGPDARRVHEDARKLARSAPRDDGLRVLGPVPAPLTLLRGRYRVRFLVHAAPSVDLPFVLRAWIGGRRLSGPNRLSVDIDPQSFL